MKHQLSFLRAASPVVLDPVLRWGEPKAGAAELWRLPMHAESRALYTFSGTAAIYQAVKVLGLDTGDTVLLPAYNCGHEVEPVLRAGADVRFYRIDKRLEIDIDHLANCIDGSTRAVLVTHYFGFPQRLGTLREICDAHGLALIEDCAHALFSRDGDEPLGLVGDLAVFSLRKTLPLPHGGALVCHDSRFELPAGLPAPSGLSTLAKRVERCQKGWLVPTNGRLNWRGRAAFVAARLVSMAARGLRTAGSRLGSPQLDPDDESFQFPSAALEWGIAPSVEAMLFDRSADAIIARRRSNYELLLDRAGHFRDFQPLFPVLPANVCPLYFPVEVADPVRCVRSLQREAVACVRWWGTAHGAVPWHEFPEASQLKKSIVALPVHQDLNDTHISYMIQCLAKRFA